MVMNEWWRPKNGRPRLYDSPEQLWADCVEYFEYTDKRKWNKTEFNGKDATRCIVPTDTPYTWTGLYLELQIDHKTWVNYNNREEFFPICTRVRHIIYTQKFEGAAVGAFNANIIARDLGLKEQSDLNLNDNRKAVADMFPNELE
jgi:hypothetical protein